MSTRRHDGIHGGNDEGGEHTRLPRAASTICCVLQLPSRRRTSFEWPHGGTYSASIDVVVGEIAPMHLKAALRRYGRQRTLRGRGLASACAALIRILGVDRTQVRITTAISVVGDAGYWVQAGPRPSSEKAFC